ncbi:hypothetical protein RB195_005183 [Necator americanus]|uniref:Uncharacterized protein n=1 Tax=Necator americanus TaxID=51031 RepID=A0ABR1BQR0_NECAM
MKFYVATRIALHDQSLTGSIAYRARQPNVRALTSELGHWLPSPTELRPLEPRLSKGTGLPAFCSVPFWIDFAERSRLGIRYRIAPLYSPRVCVVVLCCVSCRKDNAHVHSTCWESGVTSGKVKKDHNKVGREPRRRIKALVARGRR